MIDKETGELILYPEGIRISPSMSEEEFLSLPISKSVSKEQSQDENERYQENFYGFKAEDAEGNCFYVDLLFSDAAAPPPWDYTPTKTEIWWITLNYAGLPDMPGPDYRSLDIKKAWHDEWMRKTLGKAPTAKYRWGSVSSDYELKVPTVWVGINYIRTKWKATKGVRTAG